MVTYDQIAEWNTAGGEQLGRRIQLIEEGWKERFSGPEAAAEVEQSQHLYMGYRHGNICVCPLLQEHIAKELQKESAVHKERRKAREERQLAKPKKP